MRIITTFIVPIVVSIVLVVVILPLIDGMFFKKEFELIPRSIRAQKDLISALKAENDALRRQLVATEECALSSSTFMNNISVEEQKKMGSAQKKLEQSKGEVRQAELATVHAQDQLNQVQLEIKQHFNI